MKKLILFIVFISCFACSQKEQQQLDLKETLEEELCIDGIGIINTISMTINGETAIYRNAKSATLIDHLTPEKDTIGTQISGIISQGNLDIILSFNGLSDGDYGQIPNNGLLILEHSTFDWDYHFTREIIRFNTFIVSCYGEIGEPVKGYFSTTHNNILIEGIFNVTRVN